jgi:hypothetical protein
MGMPYLKTVLPWCRQNAELFTVKAGDTRTVIYSVKAVWEPVGERKELMEEARGNRGVEKTT